MINDYFPIFEDSRNIELKHAIWNFYEKWEIIILQISFANAVPKFNSPCMVVKKKVSPNFSSSSWAITDFNFMRVNMVQRLHYPEWLAPMALKQLSENFSWSSSAQVIHPWSFIDKVSQAMLLHIQPFRSLNFSTQRVSHLIISIGIMWS